MLLKALPAFCLLLLATASINEPEDEYYTNWGKWQGPRSSHIPKTYEIDLDLPYEQRMKEVIQAYRPVIESLLSYLWLDRIPLGILDNVMYPLVSYYHPDFAKEVQAIANLIENSFTKMLVLNLMYETSAACSSVLVLDKDDYVIHGRTLDFGMTSYVSNLTFHGKYYRNGSLVYEAIDVAGYAGIMTAFKPNAYSFSINMYRYENENFMLTRAQIYFEHFVQVLKGEMTPPYAIRKAFENSQDYESLVKALYETKIASRAFYIVAGAEKRQGTVITKFQDKVYHAETFDSDEKWFIAHSNYVRDVPDPKEDQRRTAATDRLEAIGRDRITRENLFSDVMDLHPTFNLYTIYTNIMQPSQNYLNTTAWLSG